VQRRHDEVAGLGGGQAGLDGLVVAHLADQDDVRVLPHRGAHGVGKSSVSTRTSRWLTIASLSKCSTSIGSSIVTTCTSLLR
jgi:hypothetical protein